MTEPRPRPRRSRKLGRTVALVAALSAMAFVGVFGGLARQMAASNDPALGPKARTVAAASPINRRVVKRTIVVRKVHDPEELGEGDDGSRVSSAPTVVAVPQSTQPAPAPAPAPAPVVTKVS